MLDDAWDAAPEGALTLRAQLRANERTAGLIVSGGSLSSVSKNNASQSYAFGSGGITATEIANVWRELIDLYDLVADSRTTAGGDTTDDAVYPEMKRRLVAVREFTTDFSTIGWR